VPANNEFTFAISVSKQTCDTKPDGKKSFYSKVRFKSQQLTPQSLLNLALAGKAFCGNFQYFADFGMPKKENFVSTSTLFFDIDYSDVPMEPYIATLRYKPTVAYTTLRNGLPGLGYRFRLVYVFNAPIVGEQGFDSMYHAVGAANQFQHLDERQCNQIYLGTCTNADTFQSGIIYDEQTFSDYKPEETTLQSKKKKSERVVKNLDSLNINNDYLKDFYQMEPSKFLGKYGRLYYKKYTEAIRTPLILDESQMFYTYPEPYYEVPRKRKGGKSVRWEVGEGRKKKLFYAAQIMKKNCPGITPENLLFNLAFERAYYYANPDKNLSNEVLLEVLMNTYKYEYPLKQTKHGSFKVNKPYWQEKGVSVFSASNLIRYYLRTRTINQLVNPNLTIKENVEVLKSSGIKITERTLRGMVTEGFVGIYDNNISLNSPSYISESADNVTISDDTNPVVKQILFLLREDGTRTQSDIAKVLGLDIRTVKRYFKQMNGSIIQREGNNRNGRWIVIEPSKKP